MFRYQLITSSIIIYLFFQYLNIANVAGESQRCQKGTYVWFCPDGTQCDDTYESCKDDCGALDTTGIIVLTIFSAFMIGLSVTSIYYFCAHRRRMATGRFDRDGQTTTDAHTQQHVAYYINPDTQINTELPIVEAPPPSYEQSQKKESKDGPENI